MGGKPLIHGALKLTNILVAPAEEGVRIVLCDFGLTRLIGEGVAFSRLMRAGGKRFDAFRGFFCRKSCCSSARILCEHLVF